MKLRITLFLACISAFASAQSYLAELDHNNTRIKILNGGDFFWDLDQSGYEIPKVTDINTPSRATIFSGAIWVGGLDENETLHLAAMTYRQRGQDFWPGPSSSDSNTKKKYDVIYTVTATEISNHIKDPSNPPVNIKTWPGNGDTTKGEPFQLAPFIDVNKNGIYEPLLGDYPKIKGIAAAYCIYNDNAGLHTETGGLPLNIDVHQLFYQDVFTYDGELFNDVNLAKFTVVNRSDNTYSNFIFGVYIDYDLGDYSDDYVGSDPLLNMTFAYNGENEDKGILGYGLNPPAQGTMFLNAPLGAAITFHNNFNALNGNPSQAAHYYNYLDAKWMNGDPVMYGGDGITGTDGTPARFMYPFDTDTTHSGKNWDEGSELNLAGDRRMLGSAKAITLAPGESVCYDMAFVYGRTTTGGPDSSVVVMKAKAAKVQEVYDKNLRNWNDGDCALGAIVLGTNDPTPHALNARIFPNPSTGEITINVDSRDYSVRICNAHGQVVFEKSITGSDPQTMDLTTPPGIYTAEIIDSEGKVFVGKLMVQ